MARHNGWIPTSLCAVATATLMCMPAAADASPIVQTDVAKVDLNLSVEVPGIAPGQSGEQTFTIQNNGQSMHSHVVLTYTTPIFINIDRTKPLPAGCVMRYQNQDFQVPEIVRCTLPPLAQNASQHFSIPITVATRAPAGPTFGTSIVLPEDGSVDAEQYITDNLAPLGVAVAKIPSQPEPAATGLDLYLAGSTPAIGQGQTQDVTFVIGNRGTKANTGPIRLDFATPLYINASSTKPLPTGCELLLKDPDPAIPEIVECSLPQQVAPGHQIEIRIPVDLVPKGPLGQQFGLSIVTADTKHGSTDVDNNLVNNLYEPSVIVTG